MPGWDTFVLDRALIAYRIRPADVHQHHFEVECRLADARDSEEFMLPSWIPGSYLLREFARHVVAVSAHSDGRAVTVEKINKNTWRCSGASGELVFVITVYALDESVRGSFLDVRRGYFNGPCVFVLPRGREGEAVRLQIEPPASAQFDRWRVATAMLPVGVDSRGFGEYAAANYDELIDHPVEMGEFERVDFVAGGVPHALVVAGRSKTDLERIAADLRRLCETQIDFFGRPPPFEHYYFLGLAVGNGYGGLEHRASSSLIFSRTDLPKVGEQGVPEPYQRFLGLASHEYFHTWHVKRTKPAAFVPYRLSERNHTRLLWVFEGITSYYQELFLVRSGLIAEPSFLKRLGELLTRVYRVPGRHVQSVAESSFEAWDMLYKPEANTPNASISYYAKGALVALALDLTLRSTAGARASLDDIVQALWQRFGRRGEGVAEDGVESLAREVTGVDLEAFFENAVRGTDDLPLADLFAAFGIRLGFRAGSGAADRGGTPPKLAVAAAPWFGIVWRAAASGMEVTTVLARSPAQAAGLNPGDILVAVDGLRVSAEGFLPLLAQYAVGDTVSAAVFRGDELLQFEVHLAEAQLDTCFLENRDDADAACARLRKAWLGTT
jgi:predicted metalloprotease with PDZ domain